MGAEIVNDGRVVQCSAELTMRICVRAESRIRCEFGENCICPFAVRVCAEAIFRQPSAGVDVVIIAVTVAVVVVEHLVRAEMC